MADKKRKRSAAPSQDEVQPKRPKPSKPPRKKTGSSTDANGGATETADGFFDDEEAWIKIYYTLLLKKATQEASMPIPPTTEILLSFNAYFQGFKEPVGEAVQSWNRLEWLLECAASPKRTRKHLADFEAAVQRVCPETKRTTDDLRRNRRTSGVRTAALSQRFIIFISLEQIASVLQEADMVTEEGRPVTAALNKITVSDVSRSDARTWKDKAVACIGVHKIINKVEHKPWDPEDVPARSLRNGPQMVNSRDDDGYANAMLNACPIPPLGFCGDLRNLQDKDFAGYTDAEKEKSGEQAKHKEHVQLMQLSRRVATARMLLKGWGHEKSRLANVGTFEEIVELLETRTTEDIEALYTARL